MLNLLWSKPSLKWHRNPPVVGSQPSPNLFHLELILVKTSLSQNKDTSANIDGTKI